MITGGVGFIATHVARHLVDLGDQVVLYARRNGNRIPPFLKEVSDDSVKIVVGDILDFPKMLETVKTYNVESIIHTAAIAYPYSGDKPHMALKVNIEGTINVLELARIMDLKRVTFTSSGAVYPAGSQEEGEFCHEDTPLPLNPLYDIYGASKGSCDVLGLRYADLYGVDFISTRHCLVYGPGAPAALPPSVFVRKALENTPIVYKQGGNHKVEMAYIKDSLLGLFLAHKKPKHKYRIYNIGAGRLYSLFELADAVKKAIPSAEIKMGPGLLEGAGAAWKRPPFDLNRAREELGYKPKFNIEQGIAAHVKFIKDGIY